MKTGKKAVDFWRAIGYERPEPVFGSRLVGFEDFEIEMLVEKMKRLSLDEAVAIAGRRGLALPRLRDVMSRVLLPGLERRLIGEREGVYVDMVCGRGEWTADVLFRDGGSLFHGTGVSGLYWLGKGLGYEAAGLMVDEIKRYDVSGIPGGAVRLKVLGERVPGMIVGCYGRRFEALPDYVRRYSRVVLPLEGEVVPVGWSLKDGFDVDASGCRKAVRGYRAVERRPGESGY